MERDGQNISNLALGSRSRVRAANRIIEVPITGISFDPAQAPATQGHFIYAYVDKKTYTGITGEPFNRRLIFRLKDVKTKQDVQAKTDRIVEDLKSQGITVNTVNIPRFNEHPHQWQLNTLLLLQGSIGFLAFIMGAVLVSQLMAAILSQQIRQIGILKAIGASRFQVFEIYIAMVLMFGIVASIIAIPLTVAGGFAFSRFVAYKLNFDILTTHLPLHLYFILASAGLLMPVLFSLPYLLKGVRVSVYEALSDYGIREDKPGKDRSATLLMPTIMVMAFRNTLRRKRRLMITVTTMALGVAIFDTGFNVRQSLWTLLSDVREGMRHDVQLVLRSQMPKESALAPFRSLENLDRIETWNGGKGEVQSRVVSTSEGVGIIALPYNTDLVNLKVEEGRWLEGSKEAEVVMNQHAVELYGHPKVGEYRSLKLAGKEIAVKLVGVVWELDRPKIYMDQKVYDDFVNPGHLINSLMFVAKDRSYDKVMALKRDREGHRSDRPEHPLCHVPGGEGKDRLRPPEHYPYYHSLSCPHGPWLSAPSEWPPPQGSISWRGPAR